MGQKRKREYWTAKEDERLKECLNIHGIDQRWSTVAHNLGEKRTANSCRLRWLNQLSPDIRRGEFTDAEVLLIQELRQMGNGWSRIAKRLPGRTDNSIKNFWNTRVKKEAKKLNSLEFQQTMTPVVPALVVVENPNTDHDLGEFGNPRNNNNNNNIVYNNIIDNNIGVDELILCGPVPDFKWNNNLSDEIAYMLGAFPSVPGRCI